MNIFLKLKETSPPPSPPTPQDSPAPQAASPQSKASPRSSQLSPSASVKSRESRRSFSQSLSNRLQSKRSSGSGGSSVHTFSPLQSPNLDSSNGFNFGKTHHSYHSDHSIHAHSLSGSNNVKYQLQDRHPGHDHRRSLPDSSINHTILSGGLKQKSRGIGRLIIPSLSSKGSSPPPHTSLPSPTSSITSAISPTTHTQSRPSSFDVYSSGLSMTAEMTNSNGSVESDDGEGEEVGLSPTSTGLDAEDSASINDNSQSPPESVFQEQNATCIQIQRIVGKRLMALEYLQEAYDCQLHWMNTSCCTPTDLAQRPYFSPQQIANRANHYLVLGLSLSLILEPGFCDSPIEFVRAVHNCLHEFEIYQASHPADGVSIDVNANINGNKENKEPPPPSTTSSTSSSSSSPFITARSRIPNVFKRNTNQSSTSKRRASSATDAGQSDTPGDHQLSEPVDWGAALNNGMIGSDIRSISDSTDTGYISPVDSMFMSQTSPTPSSQARWSGSGGAPESIFSSSSPPSHAFSSFESPTPPSANPGDNRLTNPEMGLNDQYTFLVAPRLPFDPDFLPTFATLSGVLGDCYARVMEVSDSIDVWTPEFDDVFSKMDAKLQKVIINCTVKEFEEAHRSMARNEMMGAGVIAFGAWI